ncbi:hypothetical protein DL770_008757 [Monosporascus sp. CRB-9-2]|nr:hypothetical protein DL770_008757 [Monosporascus sp. CRB-9-2]
MTSFTSTDMTMNLPSRSSSGFSPALSQASFNPRPAQANPSLRLSQMSGLSLQTLGAAEEDYNLAEELMSRYATKRGSRFSYKEATAVLGAIAQGNIENATPELVQVLLEYNADVCFQRRKSSNILKMMTNRDQNDVRSNLLENATRNCSDDILLMLAHNADEPALNQALPAAIRQNNLTKLQILLARGANATPLCKEFLDVIEHCSDQFLERLLGEVGGACQHCRDQALVRAVTYGHERKVEILLQKGANVAFDKAAALRGAIRSRRPDIAKSIASHQRMRPHTDLLDSAVGEAYAFAQNEVLEVCLRAGAKGPTTDATLIKSIEQGQRQLADILIRYGASVEYQGGASVILAVRSGQPKLLKTVLDGNPTNPIITGAISQATELDDIRVSRQMIRLLLSAGLRGDAVSETLIRVLDKTLFAANQSAQYDLIQLLLNEGAADVNIKGGYPLILAATKGWFDILGLLIQYQPSVESICAALGSAMSLADSHLRKKTVTVLVEARSNNPSDAERLETTAIALGARSLNLEILEYVVQSKPSKRAIVAGFAATMSLGNQWASHSGLPVVQFLLDQGASGPSVDDAFCQAVILLEPDAVNLLSTSISPTALNKALRGLVECSQDWYCSDNRNLWVIHSLLEWGAKGEPVDLALLNVVSAYIAGRASETLLDTLLTVGGANVNFQLGEVLKVAIRSANSPLVKKLASHGANKETMTHAFAEAIMAPLDEGDVLDLISILATVNGHENGPNFKAVSPNGHPSIVNCLTTHPESVKLVKRMAELGCDIDATFEIHLYDSLEPVTPLTWALLRENQGHHRVSSAVFEALIGAKDTANVNFTSPLSHTTPLMLASKSRRSDIVKMLLKAHADGYVRDHHDRSALFYASRGGDLDSVNALLKAKSKVNDGSLHEAARNLHADVVAALIKAKHDANFPSTEHEGRTPIQELAYRCDGSRKVSEIELTIDALEKGKVDFLTKWQQKNPLFLALNNQHPYAVTQALLGKMWSVINHEDNVFVDVDAKTRIEYYMSPTIYLTKYAPNAALGQKSELQRLLLTMQCKDRFYAGLGAEQPADAIGLPDHIAKEAKRRRDEAEKRRIRDLEHQEKMRRELEEAQLKAAIDQSRHEAWRARELEKTAQKVQQSTVLHKTDMYQQAQATTQRHEALVQKNRITEHARARDAFLKQEAVRREQELKLQFRRKMALERTALRQG